MAVPKRLGSWTSLLATLGLLFAACDTGEDGPSPTASGTPSATVRPTMSPHPGAVIVTPDPTPTATPAPDERQQVWVFDIETGDFTPLLPPVEEDHRYWAHRFYPTFTPDGQHVWVSGRPAVASWRYNLAGEMVEELEGRVGVQDYGEGILAYIRQDGGILDATVRLDGVEYGIPAADFPARALLSPDGTRVAYWTNYEDPHVTLVIADARSGWVQATVDRVGLCGCDWGPDMFWSPSGRYLAYPDFARPRGEAEDEGGYFALDAVTGTTVRLNPTAWGTQSDGWLPGDRHIVVRDGWAAVLDVPSDSVAWRVAPVPEHGSVRFAGDTVVVTEEVSRQPYAYARAAFHLQTGALLRTWDTSDASVRPLAFEGGTAFVTASTPPSPCSTRLAHPWLNEEACFNGQGLTLSPDGAHFAVYHQRALRIFRIEDGEVVEVGAYDTSAAEATHTPVLPVEWNQQGTHLLIAIGFGL